MTLWLRDDKTAQAVELLNRYSFELEGYAAESLIVAWTHHFSAEWIRLAVIEALYQGRYKAVSVEQILAFWQRRGQPLCHFSHEFERIICDRLTTSIPAIPPLDVPPSQRLVTQDNTVMQDKIAAVAPDSIGSVEATDGIARPDLEADCVATSGGVPRESKDLAAAAIQVVHGTVTELPTLPAALAAIVATGQEGKATNRDLSKPVPTAEAPTAAGFRPGAYLENGSTHQANWERLDASKHPIHDFVPAPEPSEFYVRLKTVAHQDGDEPVAPESVAESG